MLLQTTLGCGVLWIRIDQAQQSAISTDGELTNWK
jgi:hypothetical protein